MKKQKLSKFTEFTEEANKYGFHTLEEFSNGMLLNRAVAIQEKILSYLDCGVARSKCFDEAKEQYAKYKENKAISAEMEKRHLKMIDKRESSETSFKDMGEMCK